MIFSQMIKVLANQQQIHLTQREINLMNILTPDKKQNQYFNYLN